MILKSIILFSGLLFLIVANINQTITNQSYAICTKGDHTTTDGSCQSPMVYVSLNTTTARSPSIGPNNVTENITVTNSGQLATYEDPLLGFKFQYPAEWQQLWGKNIADTGVSFSLDNVFKNDDLRLFVYTEKLPENETLKQYLREVVSKEICCVDHQSLKTNETKFGDVPAMNASWNSSDKGVVFGKTLIVFAIKDKIAYVIRTDMFNPSSVVLNSVKSGTTEMYNPSSEAINKYLPTVKNIIKSFQITD